MSHSDRFEPGPRFRIIPSSSSWDPIHLAEVLSGECTPLAPTLGARDDGRFLLYPGKTHTLSSEPEAGKTWLALRWASQQMSLGNSVVFIDYEDDARAVVGRLLALGLPRQVIQERLTYIRPDAVLRAHDRLRLLALIGRLEATLVIIDGVTEAMTVEKKSLIDNTDSAEFFNTLPKPLADAGPAVLLLDHEVKSVQDRGRYSLGAQHKLAAVSGAAFKLSSVVPFSIGKVGRSHLRVVKDRPGQVRAHALDGKGLLAEMVVTGVAADEVRISLSAHPGEAARSSKEKETEARLLRAISNPKEPLLTKTAVKKAAGGNAQEVGQALNRLLESGRVRIVSGRFTVTEVDAEGTGS